MIKVTVGGQDVALDLSRTLAQSGIRPGSTLKLKLTGLLGGMPTGHPETAARAPAQTATPLDADAQGPPEPGPSEHLDGAARALVRAEGLAAGLAGGLARIFPPPAAASPARSDRPLSQSELKTLWLAQQERTEAAEMRALRERVRALERQLALARADIEREQRATAAEKEMVASFKAEEILLRDAKVLELQQELQTTKAHILKSLLYSDFTDF